jgi:Apea-like HEPN
MTDEDRQIAAKNTVRALLEETVSTMASNAIPIGELKGVAFFNMKRDALFTSLKSFEIASRMIAEVPAFKERFGAGATTRIVLQFVYQYFRRTNKVEFREPNFEALWSDFIAEVNDPYWLVRGVANIRHFDAKFDVTDLGDGITIRGRSPDELNALGFNSAVWDRIADDWSIGGPSSYVLVAENSFEKNPDNLILLDTSSVGTKAVRALGALRLVEAGSISIGRMWVVRPNRFNVGLGGLSATGASIPVVGTSRYTWSEVVERTYPTVYGCLAKLEKEGYGGSPGNLPIALRSFMATYDRWPDYFDSQLLDAITSLEALLGTESEISFRLSFRVASLLATDDNERAVLFKLMRDFYDTRSTLVHGGHLHEKRSGQLREKHQRSHSHFDELLALIRQLLRAFVVFAATPRSGYGEKFWKEELDATLLNATEREKLRAALGLTTATGTAPEQKEEK